MTVREGLEGEGRTAGGLRGRRGRICTLRTIGVIMQGLWKLPGVADRRSRDRVHRRMARRQGPRWCARRQPLARPRIGGRFDMQTSRDDARRWRTWICATRLPSSTALGNAKFRTWTGSIPPTVSWLLHLRPRAPQRIIDGMHSRRLSRHHRDCYK